MSDHHQRDSQATDFAQLMAGDGVVRQQESHRADLLHSAARRDQQTLAARRMAAEDGERDGELSLRPLPPLNPHDPVAWKRDGVQEGVYRNLRSGRYQVDARLDLHKKSVAQTRQEIRSFIDECRRHGIRTVLISHGRGRHEQALGNQLKTALNHWLPQLDAVQAFHSAQPMHGGLGAMYVLLRKSEAQRQANWEQHQKRQR
ncbi:MAG: DNA endonuclease SmrA [Marinobacterium sp.]|nr:DNA endonuclease SmrA [Marinobacterium sp.]